ncbi:MAG: hypothetical protein CM1200mP2_37730 [Planctomycetaceae bacterium]|nr:MAG: hypothetical protein CM1200mP2_37730 [Planctomycetaceae bacterium]
MRGADPWGSWLTCKETVQRVGRGDDGRKFVAARDQGTSSRCRRRSNRDSRHLSRSGPWDDFVTRRSPWILQWCGFLPEDRDDGLFFRFLPRIADKLHRGGRLQALCLEDESRGETRNWDQRRIPVGEPRSVKWIDMDNIESPLDDLGSRFSCRSGSVCSR